MKTIKSFVLIAALVVSSVLSASTPKAKAEATNNQFKQVTEAVESLLSNPTFAVEKEMTAEVTLTINKDNEIVVLSVDCENESLEGYLKSRLNYNELPAQLKGSTKTFVVPVRITAEI